MLAAYLDFRYAEVRCQIFYFFLGRSSAEKKEGAQVFWAVDDTRTQ
jgi:hypothetical protein